MSGKRTFLAIALTMLATSMTATAAVSEPLPARNCEAFAEAASAAKDYAEAATANLKALSAASAQLVKLDTHRMANALNIAGQGGPVHYVLYAAGSDGKLSPLSLMKLWSIHSGIVTANATMSLPPQKAKLDGLKVPYQIIAIDSQFLAEAFTYAGEVCRRDLGAEIVRLIQSGRRPVEATNASAALSELALRHKANVAALKERLLPAFSDSPVASARVAALAPMVFPVWTTGNDHAGARVINDVWLPKEYAEPLMKTIVEEQAKAMRER